MPNMIALAFLTFISSFVPVIGVIASGVPILIVALGQSVDTFTRLAVYMVCVRCHPQRGACDRYASL
jgi:predicted PurR-regulated permease PerM